MLLFTGAMSRIPVSILESIKLDGCGMGREIISIILPLIWPTISTLLVLNATGIFSASGPILLFTKGDYDTTTIGYWIFDMVYTYNNYNVVAAAGLFLPVSAYRLFCSSDGLSIKCLRWNIEEKSYE